MKVKIVTTIVQEVDVQLKHFDEIKPICDKAQKATEQFANRVFENSSVTTTFEMD